MSPQTASIRPKTIAHRKSQHVDLREELGGLTNILPVFRPSWSVFEPHVVQCGGAGSGKSVNVAQRMIAAAVEGKIVLIIRKVRATCKDSTFQLIKDILTEMDKLDVVEINHGELTFRFEGGGRIFHKGMDDSEKIKSVIEVDYVWIEEASELTSNDLKQIDTRVRGKGRKQVWLTMNPVDGALRVFRHFGITAKQFNNLESSHRSFGDVWVQHSTALDNPFRGDGYIEKLCKFDPEWQRIYLRGKLGAEGSCDQTIAYEYIDRAIENSYGEEYDGTIRMGVDVAKGGDDSAIAIFSDWTLIALLRKRTLNVMRVYDWIYEMQEKYRCRWDRIGVDALGIGAGVCDRLEDDKKPIVPIKSGDSPIVDADWMIGSNLKFNRLRSQMWWYTRTLLYEKGKIGINISNGENLDILREDLGAPRYRMPSESHIEVEPKLAYSGLMRKVGAGHTWGVRERLGRSTDCGDAFVYALCVDWIGQKSWLFDDFDTWEDDDGL